MNSVGELMRYDYVMHKKQPKTLEAHKENRSHEESPMRPEGTMKKPQEPCGSAGSNWDEERPTGMRKDQQWMRREQQG